MTTVAFAALAMAAFAANSVLCRLALLAPSIDPATFTTIRLVSGAVTLALVSAATGRAGWWSRWSLLSSALLALYAVPFSFAYTRLTTGTGALILFGGVQLTMLAATIRTGERVRAIQWIGLAIAFGGLLYLLAPSLATPALAPALLMVVAGVAWGVYSWRGRGAADPLAVTTSNFVLAAPLVAGVSLLSLEQAHIEPRGAVLAVASGAVASGLGYVVWYAALRGLTGTQAAVLQLSVPVIAAAGGVLFLAESVSARLMLATILVLGGIALAILGRSTA